MLFAGCAPVPSSDTSPVVTQSQNRAVDTVSPDGKPLQIVTTIVPLYAHVSNLIDGNDTVTNLVPPGSSAHFWQPKPSDIRAMEEADVLIMNGLWLEEFLADYLTDLASKGVMIVDTSTWVELLAYSAHEEDYEHNHENDHEDDAHTHEWPDPHIWLDPNNAEKQVETIAQALMMADPAQATVYTKQAEQYSDRLRLLDQELQGLFSESMVRSFIVFHDAYQYFLHAYNLEDNQVWLIQEFHGDNPSQKHLADLIATIQANEVGTIFTEPQFNPSVVKRLELETGVQSREIDPLGETLSKDGYISMMQALATAFSKSN